jgi:diguanylate cyclase (GGDEF)-like protein
MFMIEDERILPTAVESIIRVASELPEDLMFSFVDNTGEVRYVRPSRQITHPVMVGMNADNKVFRRTVVYEAWRKQEFLFQKIAASRFGFAYFTAAFPMFGGNKQFLGVLSFIIPIDGIQRMTVLQEERDILNWLLRVARDVFGVMNPDQLWQQFRDIFLQLFAVTEGLIMVESNGELVLHEHFGQGNLSAADIAWLQEDAGIFRRSTTNNQEVSLMGQDWDMDRYELQLNARREILYLLRAKGQPVHPLMSVVIDYYHLVREIVEQRAFLQELTFVDPLTEVWNRRALEVHMETYFAARNPAPAVFILFDLDAFKQLNDERGHQQGDAALKAIARYARRTLRAGDWVARLGGDEFVLVLHETSGMRFLDTKVQQGRWWTLSPLHEFSLGMTMGMVEIPGEAKTYQEAYRLADQRLYRGKQSGKRVLVFDEASSPITLIFE